MKKHILVKKIFTNGLKMGFPVDPELKRHFIEWKYTDSSAKKKFWVQQAVKKVMLIDFWNVKVPIIIDFLVKGATLNITFYFPIP